MALTKEEVLHIAKLAKLELSEKDVDKFQVQLSQILEYVAQLQKVDTNGVEGVSQVTGLQNVMREDVVIGCEEERRDAMLKEAPEVTNNMVETLGVFE